MIPILSRISICGIMIEFVKDNKSNCKTCNHVVKKLFRDKYKCGLILGLGLEDGLYGRCSNYRKE